MRWLLSCVVLAPIVSAQLDVVPTDVQMPGTQPGQVGLEAVSKCDNCHAGYDAAVEPFQGWRGGMMAHAGRDPLFWATVAVAERDFPGAGDLCLRCHSPEGWMAGRSTPTDGSGLMEADSNGVSCDVCHQLTNPDDSEHLGVMVAPFLAKDGGSPAEGYYGSGMYSLWGGQEKLGPYSDAASPHASLASSFHRRSEACGTCHDVSNPVVGDLAPNHGAQTPLPGAFSGVPGSTVEGKAAFNNPPYAYGVVERTFSEHMASAFPTLRVGDYGSLPAELQAGALQRAYDAATTAVPGGDYADGTERFFTCQTCHMRPTQGKGCDKASAPLRADLPLHDLTGGNVWVPRAIAWLDQNDELVLGGGLDSDDLAALDEGVLRAEQNLRDAASLTVVGDAVRVVNLTGHKLISGYPEGRRMWLRVRWLDAVGQTLREDGAYGDLAVMHEGEALVVRSLLDLEDPELRMYDAHMGLTQDWASALVGLGWDAASVLEYDRLDGTPAATLGDLAADVPGAVHGSFRFALNNTVVRDTRIPPYGFRRDDALERNALPVPSDAYGNPAPGGTYDYWDEHPLNPPSGAATAEIDLLYQSTSWEYVQFLALEGASVDGFLGDAGEDLMDAWLATGMAEPVVMASAIWTASLVDCNGNGIDDATDIALGMSLDTDGDGVPDECQALLEPYGCGVNPADSLVHLGGDAVLGDTLVLGLDNPLGTQAPGALTFLAVASLPDPAFPCGTLVPGLGMASAGALGELLVQPGPGVLVQPGAPWTGAGAPAPVDLAIPADLAFLGVRVYAQGMLVDPVAPLGVDLALTTAYALTLGTLPSP